MPEARCIPREGSVRERNPFPVFPGEPKIQGPIRRSPMGRRRALVLGAVHVAVLLHVLHWKLTGSTLSPVEPSESMRTLELGQINAGALFFALAILSTALFGRFFCGWGCHVVALQDLCAWIMRRLGVRPRPFRARLLVWAPLGLAVYMFAWPTLKRALVPLVRGAFPAVAAALGPPPPFPGFSNHLVTASFWATFPGVAIAVPFLLVCGFAVVYLLGAKGFCTYGCPYGAVFGAADGVAPGRIRVTDACDQCGHCTATCTSNVRVHEEVREFGMVVSPGCMKCLDCVSVCPKDALYWGFGKPATSRGAPKTGRLLRRFDLPLRGEIALAATFLLALLAWRGAYGSVPLLMGVGVALCVSFLLATLVRLLRDEDVALQNLTLSTGGRIRGAGFAVIALAVVAAALTLQSGAVRVARAAADRLDAEVVVSREEVLRGGPLTLSDATRSVAMRAARLDRLADGWTAGGLGLVSTPEVALRRAWFALVLGKPSEALGHLERAMGEAPASREARLDLARVRALAGPRDEAIRDLRRLVAEDPVDVDVHRALAATLEAAGDAPASVAELIVVVSLDPQDTAARAHLVALLERLGRTQDANRYRR
ncbi:MAG: tetratricopeptide repeat protein [bacterium]